MNEILRRMVKILAADYADDADYLYFTQIHQRAGE